MFTEFRPAKGELATTPERWAENFRDAARYSLKTKLSIALDQRWRIVRRYIPRGRVLDAGCGFGEWVMHMRRAGYRAEGLDYSGELVRRLRKAYPETPWTEGDTRQMPYPDATFDGIISWGVIEHDLPGPEAQLREFLRVLKPGARAIVTVPADSPRMRTVSQLESPAGDKFFQHFFTVPELVERITACGFRVLTAGNQAHVSHALVAPRLYVRTGGAHPFFLPLRLACRTVPWIRGFNVMIYAVGERPH